MPGGLVLPMLLSFFLNIAMLFYSGWTDRNADCCVNTVDKEIIRDTNLATLVH